MTHNIHSDGMYMCNEARFDGPYVIFTDGPEQYHLGEGTFITIHLNGRILKQGSETNDHGVDL